jgi:hypothetical protein
MRAFATLSLEVVKELQKGEKPLWNEDKNR